MFQVLLPGVSKVFFNEVSAAALKYSLFSPVNEKLLSGNFDIWPIHTDTYTHISYNAEKQQGMSLPTKFYLQI